jgi:hypothetical protein
VIRAGSLASKYLTNEQLEELNEVIQQWHGAHPDQRYVSHIHLADMPEANRPAGKGVKVPSVFGLLFFDPAAVRDPVLREIELSRATSERMFFYLQRLPLLLQWQVEGLYRQMLAEPLPRTACAVRALLAGRAQALTALAIPRKNKKGPFPALAGKGPTSPLQTSACGLSPLIAFGESKGVVDPLVHSLGLMDLHVQRNAFGRQVDSFEADLPVPALGDPPFHAVFIRAPVVEGVGDGVEVLARLPDGRIVAARQGRWLATAFHPELTDDPRFHQLYLSMIPQA